MVIQGVSYPSDFEAKKAIIAAAAGLAARGFLVAGDGSLSVRVGPNAVWVTVEGADKSSLQQDQLIRVDLNGRQMAVSKPRAVDGDLAIHLRIYKDNDSVQSIVHAYPPCAAVLSIQGTGVEAAAFSPSVRRMGRLQLLAPEADAVSAASRTDRGALLRGDGVMTWGRSLTEAVQTVETLDYYCKVSSLAGGAKACSCGRSAAGTCDGSCRTAPAQTCTGNCSTCASAPVCPACGRMLPGNAVASEPAVLPVGTTGLIRPGESLPALPAEKPAADAVPEPAAPAVKTAAVNVPREAVMAEVIRRTMGK